jgi:hypothetical protein
MGALSTTLFLSVERQVGATEFPSNLPPHAGCSPSTIVLITLAIL